MSDSEWYIIQEHEYCRSRVKMIESWKYPYCCTLLANRNKNLPNENPCSVDTCPKKSDLAFLFDIAEDYTYGDIDGTKLDEITEKVKELRKKHDM